MRTKSTQPIFTTSPHGAQTVSFLENDKDTPLHNRLIEIYEDEGHCLVMTGEELTNLCEQWFKLAKGGSK
jgi:hypothetical protein